MRLELVTINVLLRKGWWVLEKNKCLEHMKPNISQLSVYTMIDS